MQKGEALFPRIDVNKELEALSGGKEEKKEAKAEEKQEKKTKKWPRQGVAESSRQTL